MALRVGSLLVITGLTLALVFGALFVVVGALLIAFGGIVLALGVEPALMQESMEADVAAKPVDAEDGDVAA
jgi:hypothetical protein